MGRARGKGMTGSEQSHAKLLPNQNFQTRASVPEAPQFESAMQTEEYAASPS
jgi:hypothetical protein